MTMTFEELKRKQTELEKMIKSYEEQKNKELEEEIREDEIYQYIGDDGEICSRFWENSVYDIFRKDVGNFFPIKKYKEHDIRAILEYRIERAKIENIMKKYSTPSKPFNNQFMLTCASERQEDGFSEKKVYVLFNLSNYGVYSFDSGEKAKRVIEICGEKNLINYWFTSEEEHLKNEDI